MKKLPLYLRFVLWMHRIVGSLGKFMEMVRDEVAWRLVPLERRQEVTNLLYERTMDYSPGGEIFNQGLFDWETKGLDSFLPSGGNLLIGGAGGGREVSALLERGFRIWAFEPSFTLFERLESLKKKKTHLNVWRESYEELVERFQEDPKGYRQKHELEEVDGILLGWGSFSHVSCPKKRLELLVCLKNLAPNAPVFLSFLLRDSALTSRWEFFRPWVQTTCRWLGGKGERREGDVFYSGSGFVHRFSREELTRQVEEAGYSLGVLKKTPYPHALLLPKKM